MKEIPKKILITLKNIKRSITEQDKKILKTHNFEQIETIKSYIYRNRKTFKCKKCSIETDTIYDKDGEKVICVFFTSNNDSIKFDTCQVIIMQKACE